MVYVVFRSGSRLALFTVYLFNRRSKVRPFLRRANCHAKADNSAAGNPCLAEAVPCGDVIPAPSKSVQRGAPGGAIDLGVRGVDATGVEAVALRELADLQCDPKGGS